jgi:hypothetical protein
VHCVWRCANRLREATAEWGEDDTIRCAHTYSLAHHLFPREELGHMASCDDHAIILVSLCSFRRRFVENRVAEHNNRGPDEAVNACNYDRTHRCLRISASHASLTYFPHWQLEKHCQMQGHVDERRRQARRQTFRRIARPCLVGIYEV